MRSQERHELKKNELADTLERLQAFFIRHGSKVLVGVILVVVVVMAGIYFYRSAQMARMQAWEQLFSARNAAGAGAKPDDLQLLAQQTSDPNLAAFAWKQAGDMWHMQSMTESNPTKKSDLLDQARKAYESVVNKYPNQALAAGSAKMGLGVILEDQGKFNEAKKVYQEVIDEKPLAGTGLPEQAAERLAGLDRWELSAKTPLATTQPATKAPATKPAKSS